MRNFALTSVSSADTERWLYHKGYNYLLRLDQEAASVHHFIRGQNPNYRILNYTPGSSKSFSSKEELMTKGFLKEAYIYNSTGEAPAEGTPNALLVFPAKLNYHEGLFNNFTGYDNVFLCFFTEEELHQGDPNLLEREYGILPDILFRTSTALGTSLEPNTTRLVSLKDPTETYPSDFGYAQGRLVLDDAADSYISTKLPAERLDSSALSFNQYRLLSYEASTHLVSDSKFQPFEEAHFIVSLYRAEGNLDSYHDPERAKPSHYLSCRFAASGSYYTAQVTQFTYTEHATASFGQTNLLILADQIIRLSLTEPGSPNSMSIKARAGLAYLLDPYQPILYNKDHIPGTGGFNPSYHIHIEKQTEKQISSEEIFTESYDEITRVVLENYRIPCYTININEGPDLNNALDVDNSSFMISIG